MVDGSMKAFYILSIIFVVIAICLAGYFTGLLRLNYPSEREYPVQGIDISHHQGNIDWSSIPKEKVQFVYMKATEGGDWRDKAYTNNWSEAQKAGFKVGAYHFFTLCKDGKTQARNFIEFVKAGGDTLAPAIDLEYVGNCSARPSKDEFLKQLSNFIGELRSVYQDKPVLYTTHEFYKDYLEHTDFASYPLWIRDVISEPSVRKYPSMIMWQYADNARVDGIKGPVDLNIHAQIGRAHV